MTSYEVEGWVFPWSKTSGKVRLLIITIFQIKPKISQTVWYLMCFKDTQVMWGDCCVTRLHVALRCCQIWRHFLIPVLIVSAYETVFIYKCIACVFKYLRSVISVSRTSHAQININYKPQLIGTLILTETWVVMWLVCVGLC